MHRTVSQTQQLPHTHNFSATYTVFLLATKWSTVKIGKKSILFIAQICRDLEKNLHHDAACCPHRKKLLLLSCSALWYGNAQNLGFGFWVKLVVYLLFGLFAEALTLKALVTLLDWFGHWSLPSISRLPPLSLWSLPLRPLIRLRQALLRAARALYFILEYCWAVG